MKNLHSILVSISLLAWPIAVLAQPAPTSAINWWPVGPVSALTGGVSDPRFPADKAVNVNPDTHLILTFASAPTLGTTGQIRIYDAATDQVVDTLDLSIPPGPVRAARGPAPAATPAVYQENVIGGFKEGFHFYPVIIHDNVAVIYPHNHKLDYNHGYYVQIDPGVLTLADNSFKGISGKDGWTFATKKAGPAKDAAKLTVAADGSGDFNTVQGALDYIPEQHTGRVTVLLKKGTYEEIVYFRNQADITILGEDRDGVVVGYANDETLNGQSPDTPKTNELPTTFPYRRVAFMADHCTGIQLVNFTIKNFTVNGAQCEALLLVGGKNLASHISLCGHTDTLQFNDSVYIADSYIEGAGDFLWGRGPAFFYNCNIRELRNNPMMWVRSTSASHGFVYSYCQFDCGQPGGVLARNTAAYPDSEVVLLNCKLGAFSPAGWTLGNNVGNMHYWEYNSTNLSDGQPVDVSQRAAGSKQLTMANDADTIKNYSDPAYVLGGWAPTLAPLILTQPILPPMTAGSPVTISVTAAAVPEPTYQWSFNGVPLKDGDGVSGATTASLTLAKPQLGNVGKYTVEVANSAGKTTSEPLGLIYGGSQPGAKVP